MIVAILVVGAFAFTAKAADCTITKTLKFGMKADAEVMCLQTKLGVTPAAGNFGPLTLAAVKAFQTTNSLTADGIVGALSRAALNVTAPVVGTLPAGCTTASGFSTTTGLSCAATALPAGCTSTTGFSSTTGAKCDGSTTGSITTTGVAGDLTLTSTSTDVEDTAIEGQATKVLGFKAEATDSDIAVRNVKITLTNSNAPTTSYRLSNYIDSVDVFMGSTKVGSADVADFTKSGYSYSKSIALSDAVVKKGTVNKATFYVVLNAVSSIDSTDMATAAWNLGINEVRYEDGTGVIMTTSTADTSANPYAGALKVNGLAFGSLTSSGDVKLTISKGSGSPSAQNVEVSDTSSTPDVKMLEFKLKATGSDLSFDQLTLDLTGVVAGANNLRTMITDMSLKNGSDVLATDPTITAADTGTAAFTLDDTYTISKGDTQTFTVYAKIAEVGAGKLTNNDSLQVSLAKTGIATEDANGDIVGGTHETGSATGTVQTFNTTSAVVSNVHWSVPTTGTIIDLFFTVNANNEDFDVNSAEILDAAAASGTSSITNPAGSVYETAAHGILSKYSGDAVTAIPTTGYTVAAGDTTTFRVRYSLTGGTNGLWNEITVTSIGGQAVADDTQTSPTATITVN
jgi:peptidoglycan hydrolase-like protein with peptidoglycan-binding domain